MGRSFTLLEMVLVIGILATLAGVATVMVGGVHDQANGDLARREMHAIRDAALRFQADTGWLPTEGPFDLAAPSRSGEVQLSSVPGQDWFDCAANLAQLVVRPVLVGPNAGLATWDPDRRRGWRGPYLSMDGEGFVSVGACSGRQAYASPISGDVAAVPVLPPFPAVADPFLVQTPESSAAPFFWTSYTDSTLPLTSQGRPYLLFLPRDTAGRVVRDGACVVCMGVEGVLDPSQNLVLHLFR